MVTDLSQIIESQRRPATIGDRLTSAALYGAAGALAGYVFDAQITHAMSSLLSSIDASIATYYKSISTHVNVGLPALVGSITGFRGALTSDALLNRKYYSPPTKD